ncbi:hypothetical protein [Janthinobacterium sp. UMAB-56]|nr:hypothetical protein [Janthinobacterium sp. UMAB-56]
MKKIASLRRYGSHAKKTFIKRNGKYSEREILMLLRSCFPCRFTPSN